MSTRHGAAAQRSDIEKLNTRRLYQKAIEQFNKFISENVAIGYCFETYADALCYYLNTLHRRV